MIKSLNRSVLEDALIQAGMNQADLAGRLDVSREAVSKWFQGETFPKPDKLLRIGMMLGLDFDQLVYKPPAMDIPIVTFRKKGHRITRDEHLDNAREVGELLKRLVKYLPDDSLVQPPVLREPKNEYEYVQQVAAKVRGEMGLVGKRVINFGDLIAKFHSLHAVIIPVLWGAREYHGNALNIHLPDSKTTWVFLNLDSNVLDFKFWMAHELGHALAPAMEGEAVEDFADSFAQALLFPKELAADLYTSLSEMGAAGSRVSRVLTEAKKHIISPYTIKLALDAYARQEKMPCIELGQKFMGAVTVFARGYETISQSLFKKTMPVPEEYIRSAHDNFQSPFFDASKRFCQSEDGAEHFIHQVLSIPLADAKALATELRK